MNPLQWGLQIKSDLQAATWPQGSQELVFGENQVKVTAGLPDAAQLPRAFPYALVNIGGGSHDPEDPEYIPAQSFDVIVGAVCLGDPLGQNAIVGGPVDDVGQSGNRGVQELADIVLATLGNLTTLGAGAVTIKGSGRGATSAVGNGRHIAYTTVSLVAEATARETYAAPKRFKRSGGDWVWNGDHCSARFDFVQYVLVQKDGSDPSDDPSDGTIVYSGTTPSFTGVPVGGVYTVFAQYDKRGGTAVDGYSQPELGSYD